MKAERKDRDLPAMTGRKEARKRCPLCPNELVYHGRMRNGRSVTLRPIQSEDLDTSQDMFSACSPKSLYKRYERRVLELPGELAAQLCSIDGQRDMTIVAEIEVGGVRKIIGVGQLLPDPDYVTAEYAVLVADPWQGKGLGNELTDFCLEVARQCGIKRIVGEFSPSNIRIIHILECRDFQLSRDQQQQLVYGEKTLG